MARGNSGVALLLYSASDLLLDAWSSLVIPSIYPICPGRARAAAESALGMQGHGSDTTFAWTGPRVVFARTIADSSGSFTGRRKLRQISLRTGSWVIPRAHHSRAMRDACSRPGVIIPGTG